MTSMQRTTEHAGHLSTIAYRRFGKDRSAAIVDFVTGTELFGREYATAERVARTAPA